MEILFKIQENCFHLKLKKLISQMLDFSVKFYFSLYNSEKFKVLQNVFRFKLISKETEFFIL